MSTVIERPPRHKAELWEPPKASSAVRGPSPVVLVALLALTLFAGAIRVKGLDAPDGRMDTDETRLALATDGVLQTGLPVMPTGRIYTRGLLNSYLIAPSF